MEEAEAEQQFPVVRRLVRPARERRRRETVAATSFDGVEAVWSHEDAVFPKFKLRN